MKTFKLYEVMCFAEWRDGKSVEGEKCPPCREGRLPPAGPCSLYWWQGAEGLTVGHSADGTAQCQPPEHCRNSSCRHSPGYKEQEQLELCLSFLAVVSLTEVCSKQFLEPFQWQPSCSLPLKRAVQGVWLYFVVSMSRRDKAFLCECFDSVAKRKIANKNKHPPKFFVTWT